MLTLTLMILDLLLAFFIVLTVYRLVRAIFMRLKFMGKIGSICKDKKYTIKKLRFPLISIFYKSKKIDLTITTSDIVYHVKFISSLSSKKVYHFIDENNYVTYLKMYLALPMATKTSESIHFLTFHRFPIIEKTDSINHKYILLFNPLPNNITYIAKDGSNQIAGNGSMIGDFYVYNGKGFCTLLQEQ